MHLEFSPAILAWQPRQKQRERTATHKLERVSFS